MKKLATIGALLVALMGAPALAQPSGSAEVMVGQKSATLDAKLGGQFAPKFGYFGRNITTLNYDGKVSNFLGVDLTYDLGKGVSLLAEGQFTDTALPRAGLQYFQTFGDFSLYAAGTANLRYGTDGEVFVVADYTPQISPGVKAVVHAEACTNFGKKHNFSGQKLRLGVGQGSFSAGVGVNFSEAGQGEDLVVDYNPGIFFGYKF